MCCISKYLWAKNIFMDEKYICGLKNIFVDLKIYLWTKIYILCIKYFCCLKNMCCVKQIFML